MQHNFAKYYKTISNTELLSILENPSDYQPDAIEAAKKELSYRQLSDSEIAEAKEPILAKKLQKEKQQETIRVIENKVRTTGITLFETLNPIQTGIQTVEKIIRFIVVIFGLLFIYQVIKDRFLIIESIKEIISYPVESLIYLFPFVLLPMAMITFWKRKSIGWILLTIYLTYSFVATAWIFIHSILWKPTGNAFFDNFLSPPPIMSQVLQLIFFGGVIYVISKKNIREQLLISESKMLATIILSGSFTLLIIYLVS